MKTLLLIGSPRKEGTSSKIAGRIKEICPETEIFHAYDLKIKGCNGCEVCKEIKRCVFSDDMDVIYGKIKEADRIIIVSPVYFFGFPGPLKTIIDRTQVFWNHPLPAIKKGMVILTGEAPNRTFEEFYEKSCRYIFKNWGIADLIFKIFGSIQKFEDIKPQELEDCIRLLEDKE